jgi:hypothetical protein
MMELRGKIIDFFRRRGVALTGEQCPPLTAAVQSKAQGHLKCLRKKVAIFQASIAFQGIPAIV